MQSDPIGLDGGVNTFGYIEGNPIVNVDKLGLKKNVPTCKGKWRIMLQERILPIILQRCACYWLCYSCKFAVAWSGNPYSLDSTTGNSFYDGTGSVKKPSGCLCDKPSLETGCKNGKCGDK